MPRDKLINNEQKNQESICMIFDCLHVWSVQDNAEELSVTCRMTGWGLSVMGEKAYNMESCAIVDYHHHKLEYVDQHEHAVIVVAPESECMLNHLIRETNVPPEYQSDGISSSAFEQTISNCCCKRCLRD